MALKSAKVPEALAPLFERAEAYVSSLFADFAHEPERGTLHIGGERYVIMRCESLYIAWFDALAQAFGGETAGEFIYNTAREIGRSDSAELAARLGVAGGVERLSAGPIHFSHAGWALVEILDDSTPAADDSYFLHYVHPNTFESEVLARRGRTTNEPACLFSAGYSAGWCSEAFGVELHGREIRCAAAGDERCEFIMAPAPRLDGLERRMRGEPA